MSKCTMAWCGETATHVVRWRNNMGQRFCQDHAEGVYERDTQDTTVLEPFTTTTGKGNTDQS